MPARSPHGPDLVPYSAHFQLDPAGSAWWEPGADTTITMIGFMGEETEIPFRLWPRDGICSEFSSLHLSLLWPELMPLATAVLVDRSRGIQLLGPKRGLVVLAGIQRR